MLNSKILFKLDFLTILLALSLATFGIIGLAGSGATVTGGSALLWNKQLQWVILGFFSTILFIWVDFRFLLRWSPLLYGLGIFGLLLCFTPLAKDSHGAHSWLKIGGLPQVQPSEFAKIATILFLARYLSTRKEKWVGFLDLIRPLMIGALPALLVIKQPDYGTALVFGPITLAMMYIAGMPYSYLLLLVSPAMCLLGISHDMIYFLIWFGLFCGLILIIVITRVPWSVWIPLLALNLSSYCIVYTYGHQMWEHIPNHAKERLVGYLNPDFDIRGTNYNINQSKIALGSGGFWGKGIGGGTQSRMGFLPEFEHDFVLPVIGEQVGFFGIILLLGLFLLLMLRCVDTALTSKSLQGSLVVVGIAALFFTHIFINIGMVTGLLPVTGLPLTFISYGGSFMLCNMIAIGLICSVRLRTINEIFENSFLSGRSLMNIPRKIQDEF